MRFHPIVFWTYLCSSRRRRRLKLDLLFRVSEPETTRDVGVTRHGFIKLFSLDDHGGREAVVR